MCCRAARVRISCSPRAAGRPSAPPLVSPAPTPSCSPGLPHPTPPSALPLLAWHAGLKRLQNAQAQQDRFRALLSDGEYSHSCMLATQLAELIHTNTLKENSIVTLHDYISNQVQNKKCVCAR